MIASHIVGTLVGRIWMPSVECQKTVHINLNHERDRYSGGRAGSLRYIVVRACADGDFQGASFTGDSELIVSSTRFTNGTRVTRIRAIPLKRIRSIRDCVAARRVTWDHTRSPA